ncbi:MAG: hypothetical protein LBC17_03870 [Lactobacillaceae bacterium]|jgi:hypothetical protein|nr:hypothetical protein [Lactobacillaceae bacterium]
MQKKIEIKVRSTLVVNPVKMLKGNLSVVAQGISFERDFSTDFLDIPFTSIKYISVQKVFGFYWRGIFVKTNDDKEIQLLTSNTKKLIQQLATHLKPDQIRFRKSVLER